MAKPPSKRRRIQNNGNPSSQDDGNPSSQDNNIIKFEKPPKVFTDRFDFINELQSFLKENVGFPIKLLIVFYGLLGCSNDDTYLQLGDMLREIGIKSEVFDGDDGDIETMKNFYDDGPNAAVIFDTRGSSPQEIRQVQSAASKCGASKCGAVMQYVFDDKPDMERLRNNFVCDRKFAKAFIEVAHITAELNGYPDNPDCIAILSNDEKYVLDFAICVRNNTQLDFEYAAKIFATYLFKKEEIFQVPSLEDL
jgi:hypothetical protein